MSRHTPSQQAPTLYGRALKHRSFMIGAVLTLLVILAATLSLVWTPWSPYEIDMAAKLKTPDFQHWLGTDPFGRDIVSLILVEIGTSCS